MDRPINELAAALCKAQAKMKPAYKSRQKTFFKSTYADLSDVWDSIREPLTSAGLCIIQTIERKEPTEKERGYNYVHTMLVHTSGQYITSDTIIHCEKQDAQSFGKAITYARRYALMALVGVASSDDDDDGESAMGRVSYIDETRQNYLRRLFSEDKNLEKQILQLTGASSVEKIQEKYANAISKLLEKRHANTRSHRENEERKSGEVSERQPEAGEGTGNVAG